MSILQLHFNNLLRSEEDAAAAAAAVNEARVDDDDTTTTTTSTNDADVVDLAKWCQFHDSLKTHAAQRRLVEEVLLGAIVVVVTTTTSSQNRRRRRRRRRRPKHSANEEEDEEEETTVEVSPAEALRVVRATLSRQQREGGQPHSMRGVAGDYPHFLAEIERLLAAFVELQRHATLFEGIGAAFTGAEEETNETSPLNGRIRERLGLSEKEFEALNLELIMYAFDRKLRGKF